MKSTLLSILAISSLLTACATPPGKLTEKDFDSKEYTVQASMVDAIKKLQVLDRTCGGLIKEFAPSWAPLIDDQNYKIDLFLVGVTGVKQDWVGGLIELNKITAQSTNIKFSVQKVYSRPLFGKSEGWHKESDEFVAFIENKSKNPCE